ncbi:TIGR00730 family Rossman fold protein [Paenibacillus sp. JX-17]|uniref:Cytokinin riboside 5'-monophosphate phosphoribohydrolase n=1 Tax=Paenibacillus lacisoli TaxID=3064525 RepID=A0ABT9CFR9_9BACL|nr:TIGR00730 family Rossman fold protein [Paenibacillus sp. JX-17]MDO7906448.1 TIGR00730 family Rossman fold protein [Paenibacillus sp. JX-17]
MKSICVFAASRTGTSTIYIESAARLGRLMAEQELRLVYGGSKLGLMGETANAVLAHGGQVTGIMPTSLFLAEIVHPGLTEFIEVADMHERKAKMGRSADAFIALPGGLGTFEELFEVLCWAQIGIHRKPIGLLNMNGYYDPLLAMMRHSIEEGFTPSGSMDLILASDDPELLLQQLGQSVPVNGYPS